jgi:hypothetical protein
VLKTVVDVDEAVLEGMSGSMKQEETCLPSKEQNPLISPYLVFVNTYFTSDVDFLSGRMKEHEVCH